MSLSCLSLYPSAAEMQSCDERTIASGTPSKELMNKAGRSVCNVIMSRYPEIVSKPVTVLCGPGNNGGDGLVIFRELTRKGVDCVAIVAATSKYSEDFLFQLDSLKDREQVFLFGELDSCELSLARIERLPEKSAFFIDCLLGTGQQGEPRKAIGKLVRLLNNFQNLKRIKIVSVDIPTGVSSDTGESYSEFKVDLLVSIQAKKRGLTQYPAKDRVKDYITVDIGIHMNADDVETLAIEELVSEALAFRAPNVHKGDFGKVMVVAGSRNMPGAAVLASEAALRTGAGLVTLCSKPGWKQALPPELMLCDLPEGDEIVSADISSIQRMITDDTVVILGPGMSVDAETEQVFKTLLNHKGPLVVDAGALSYLSGLSNVELGAQAVLTPHPGEAARLLGITTAEVQASRFDAVRELAKRTGSTVVLKGASTLVCNGTKIYVCEAGTPYMASAGMGDVLTGMIAAYVARGLSPDVAAATGVYIHAKAGEVALEKYSSYLLASDLFPFIGKLEFSLLRAKT